MAPRRLLPGALLLSAVLAACASPPPKPTIPLEVEYAGCRAVRLPGPVCELAAERGVRLWVGAPPDAHIEIRAGGRRIDAAGEPVREGQRFALTLPAGADRVDVLVESGAGQATWSLPLVEPGESTRLPRRVTSPNLLLIVHEATIRVNEQIRDRRLTSAREALEGLSLPLKAPAESRYLVSYYRGLLAEKEDDYRSALAEVQKAVEIAERVDEKRFQWMAEEKLALLLRGLGRSREAAALFERLGRMPHSADACEEAQFLNNQAWSTLLAREAGESLPDPTPLFERSLKIYPTCENYKPEKRLNILINLALSHLREGRLPRAQDLLAEARQLRRHATLLHRLWWLDLEARIALEQEQPAVALRLFQELEELAEGTSSSDGRLRAAFGQARSHQALGDRTAALEVLREAEALLDEQSLQIPLHEGRETFMTTRQALVSLHIELLLDQDRMAEALAVARRARSRMLRQLERSDRLANLKPDRRARWVRLLADYQDQRIALEERAMTDWSRPTDQLRREQAARKEEAEAVKKLLDQAFQVLGDAGETPGEAAPAPMRLGELILAYHPLPRGWVGFAADGRTVAAHRFELPPQAPPKELAQRLLLPFQAAIGEAERIRILASGPLRDVDFHALPFAGDVLLASHPVVYGLDLPASSDPAPPARRQALLVTDPQGNLPGALAEARAVKAALDLQARPWITEELRAEEASAAAVLRRLGAAGLLHYAGHGTFSGFGGWDSSLLLAEGTRLTLGDLLALEGVPAWVVLSGCDTGRASAETSVESLGLAHAFLLAGSQAVIASTRPADDRTVPAFFTELYRQWDGERNPALALQRAQLAWRQGNPRADWAGFRLFEP